ncbi:hypothetical protein HZA44_03330 [Candidatus Peregrinibacteria bacterium]|nr:hypothetical protein [Candidatus Peregrinibacteria bacterium]
MNIRSRQIIGIALSVVLLFAQAGNALAIFSPVLSKEVSEIKKDVMTSRQQNGVGSWLNAMEKVNARNADFKSRGLASGTSGGFEIFMGAIKDTLIQGITESFMDGFSLLLGSFFETKTSITTCLRDDIWAVQALQEQVINEMLKAGLLDDLTNGHILLNDYHWLQARIDGGRKDVVVPIAGAVVKPEDYEIKGLKKRSDDTAYWVPGGSVNYYVECPYGEFKQAIDEAKVSLTRLVETFSGNGLQLGSLADMWALAKKRAVKRAADYIAKNQISISFGGETGANSQGLINGYGLAGLGADAQGAYDQLKLYGSFLEAGSLAVLGAAEGAAVLPQWIASQTFGANTAIYTWEPSEGFKANKAVEGDKAPLTAPVPAVLNELQRAKDLREMTLKKASNTLTFNLSLNHVSENNLKDIEAKMVLINTKILESTDPKALPGACDQIATILNSQCKNKQQGNPISCKQ